MTPLKITAVDWEKVVDYAAEQQRIADFVASMDALTGRELYEMHTLSLVNRFLIDRPISRAFRKTLINYDVKPIEIMRSCMVDGFVFLRVEDKDHIRILKHVTKATFDDETEETILIETKFIYYDEQRRGTFYHIERFERIGKGMLWTVFQPVAPSDVNDEKKWVTKTSSTFPVFIFVGIRWVDDISFLLPLKDNIINLERAFRVIGAENIERMGLQIYISGVRNVDDIKSAPRRMGRRIHILPTGAQFDSPGSDAPGKDLMIDEIINLTVALEKASCVVAAEKLAVLSGVSRSIAEEPLNALAESLRDLFEKGMMDVWELARRMGGAEKPIITYRPLKIIEDKLGHLKILDRAVDLNAISPEEEVQELRLLLELSPELRTPVSSQERQRLQDKEAENGRNSNSDRDNRD